MRRAAAWATAPTASPCCATPTATACRDPLDPPWRLSQPFGMALIGDTLYVGNTDGLVAFPYAEGPRPSPSPGRRLPPSSPAATGPAASCRAPTAPGSTSVSVRSATSPNTASKRRRAAPRSTSSTSPPAASIFASGLRNPVGLAWEPTTGALWTVVNERDGLGDEPRPTTSPPWSTAASTAGPTATGASRRRPRPPGRAGSRPRSPRTSPSAATPPRSACAGSPKAPCPASRTAW